jgi:hypothetical protein
MSILLALLLVWCAANLAFVFLMSRRAHVRARERGRTAALGG